MAAAHDANGNKKKQSGKHKARIKKKKTTTNEASSSSDHKTKKNNRKRRRKPTKKRPETLATTNTTTMTSTSSSSSSSSSSYTVSSLLPPPLPTQSTASSSSLSSGLSSWEEFLGRGTRTSDSSSSLLNKTTKQQQQQQQGQRDGFSSSRSPGQADSKNDDDDAVSSLPSIRDLFPPPNGGNNIPNEAALSSSPSSSEKGDERTQSQSQQSSSSSSSSSSNNALDGVLPVSELFYRSSQALNTDSGTATTTAATTTSNSSAKDDDDELPFSAEQSDELTSDDNRVHIRRNRAAQEQQQLQQRQQQQSTTSKSQNTRWSGSLKRGANKGSNRHGGKYNSPTSATRGRKLVRRGMEMFLGGTPIHADPPQRAMELYYSYPSDPMTTTADTAASNCHWARTITLDTSNFGPLLDNDSTLASSSSSSVCPVEVALFCEHLVSAAIKWDVCPKELRDIVKNHMLEVNRQDSSQQSPPLPTTTMTMTNNATFPQQGVVLAKKVDDEVDGLYAIAASFVNDDVTVDNITIITDDNFMENYGPLPTLSRAGDEMNLKTMNKDEFLSMLGNKQSQKPKRNTSAKGFGKKTTTPKKSRLETIPLVACGAEFELGVSIEELETVVNSRESGSDIMGRIFARGLTTHLNSRLGFERVRVDSLRLREGDDGSTHISMNFRVECRADISEEEFESQAALFDSDFIISMMTDPDLSIALAAAAKTEAAWPKAVRDRVVEEFLLQDDDVNMPWGTLEPKADVESEQHPSSCDATSVFDCNSEKEHEFDHHGETFSDCSPPIAANAPFGGRLGPELANAVTAHALERPPRVIAIGDVHGCINELQDLLRQCSFWPGDQVVFLGDLVCKGPDSISVVKMAREIGAIAVRGNHDFEVIRWHQAIKAGVDPPVVGSEHFHIASCLSQSDMEWMHSQPWYMTSKDLGTLFVHAGFVSGIRLSKQNPRLMMNMRSILPDGTVTSKFFNNWPWARLWDGPQTVLFGHDADRGLQQYEHAIGLDTGCVYGGRLTACLLPEKRLVSVKARQRYFKYRRRHYD